MKILLLKIYFNIEALHHNIQDPKIEDVRKGWVDCELQFRQMQNSYLKIHMLYLRCPSHPLARISEPNSKYNS